MKNWIITDKDGKELHSGDYVIYKHRYGSQSLLKQSLLKVVDLSSAQYIVLLNCYVIPAIELFSKRKVSIKNWQVKIITEDEAILFKLET